MDEQKLTRDELLAKEIHQERQNASDAIYINLTKFLGAMILLTGVAIIIINNMRISLGSSVLFIMGLSILGGALLWEYDDKKNLDKVNQIKEDMANEESETFRFENHTQNN